MKRYYQYGKKHFEFGVRDFLIKERLGFLTDITEQYIAEGNETWERIYTVSTANKSVHIMIFSSVDMRTDYVREHGDDAVRIVLRWKTKNGYRYKKVAKHLRINTLFSNMKKTITATQKEVFSLSYGEFKEKI